MSETIYKWQQDPDGGEHGTLTLWPGTHRELRMSVADFKTAHALGMGINGTKKDAYEAGRRSMKADVARILICPVNKIYD